MDTASSTGLLVRIRTEPLFRNRLLNTAFVVWMFITLGWNAAVVGSVFPDLRLIIHKDLDTASWIFTVGSIGYLAGALFFGVLFDRYNRLLLLTTVTALSSVTFGVIPWCENFAVMLMVNFCNSFFSGGIDVGGNTHIASIWGRNSATYMQSIHFGFSFGGILSPFTAEPFVAPKQCQELNINGTRPQSAKENFSTLVESTTIANTSISCQEFYGKTHIQYAYLIGALITLTAAVPFLTTYQLLGKKQSEIDIKDDGNDDITNKSYVELPRLSLKRKAIFVTLLMLLISLYASIEGRFSSLLSSFVVDYQGWTKTDSLHISSMFWGAFAAGRFLSIGVAKVFRPATMILAYLSALFFSFIGFLIGAEYTLPTLIWLCTATTGLSMSSIFPCIFTWTAESILVVTGKISAVYIIGVSVFNAILPLLYGYLMDNFNPQYFSYLLLSQSVLCFVVYAVIRVLIMVYVTPLETDNTI